MTKAPATVIDTSDSKWHWDRKVPIALILTLIIAVGGQTLTGIWWASKMDSRVETLEKQSSLSAPQGDRLTRLEVKVETVQSGITEIKDILRSSAKR